MKNNFIIVAGPCSAESLEQVLTCAHELCQKKIAHFFRAGIWKPRTSPHSFQGYGEKALPWVKEVQERYQLPAIVEVATAQHVSEVLKMGIKGVWIGARTVVNPFSVQEIAQALKDAPKDFVIYIKNPIHPDLKLWMGAWERIKNLTSLSSVGVIHRGFALYGKHFFRYPPLWELALSFKKHYPDVPMLLDPSHMAGKKELIPSLLQMAVERNYQGIFVEVHPYPSLALSDSEQQITPEELRLALENIKWKQRKPQTEKQHESLQKERQKIDTIDEEIIKLLAQRKKIVQSIQQIKEEEELTALQFERFQQILKSRALSAKNFNLSEEMIEEIFTIIHEYFLREQTKK